MSAAKSQSGGRRRATSARKADKKTVKKTVARKKPSSRTSAGKSATKTTAKKKSAPTKAKKKAVVKKAKKKAVVRKTKKTPARKTTAKKKAVRKTTAAAGGAGKKTTGRKAPRKKVAARKTPARKTATRSAATKRGTEAPAAPGAPGPSALRYKEALDAYSKAVDLLQKKDWPAASRALADVVSEYPRERELAERARMYLRVCSQHLEDDDAGTDDFDDLYYRAVVLSNQGRTERSLEIVQRALQLRVGSRKAMYLQASILAAGGRRREALDALAAAIDLDEQNRIFATNDPDFAGLRDDEEFITLTTREDDEEV